MKRTLPRKLGVDRRGQHLVALAIGQFECHAILRDGLARFAALHQGVAETVVGLGITGLNLNCRPERPNRLVRAPVRGQRLGQAVVPRSPRWAAAA